MTINHHERVVLGESPQGVVDEHLTRYRFAASHVAGLRCLDVACGTGYGSRMLVAAGAQSVVGGDISDECVAFASKTYGGVAGLTFQRMDATATKLSSNTFDLVVSFETFEHLRQPELFLEEAHRVLRPGGEVILSTPNPLYSCFPYGFLAAKRRHPNNVFHVREWTIGEIKKLAKKGFRVKSIYAQGGKRLIPFLLLTSAVVCAPFTRQTITRTWNAQFGEVNGEIVLLRSGVIPKFTIWVLSKI